MLAGQLHALLWTILGNFRPCSRQCLLDGSRRCSDRCFSCFLKCLVPPCTALDNAGGVLVLLWAMQEDSLYCYGQCKRTPCAAIDNARGLLVLLWTTQEDSLCCYGQCWTTPCADSRQFWTTPVSKNIKIS